MQIEILFIGSNSAESTSRYRANALRRLGCIVEIIDLQKIFANSSLLLSKIHYLTGYKFLQGRLLQYLQRAVTCLSLKSPDCVWIDAGVLIGPALIKFLKFL